MLLKNFYPKIKNEIQMGEKTHHQDHLPTSPISNTFNTTNINVNTDTNDIPPSFMFFYFIKIY